MNAGLCCLILFAAFMRGFDSGDRPANPLSGFLAFASGMWARTSDLRRLFGCLTLGAAVLARRCHARTERVCTFLGFLRNHFLSSQLRIKSGCPSPNASSQEKVFLYRNEHIAILVASGAAVDGNPLASATSPATSLRTAGARILWLPGWREPCGLTSSESEQL